MLQEFTEGQLTNEHRVEQQVNIYLRKSGYTYIFQICLFFCLRVKCQNTKKQRKRDKITCALGISILAICYVF